MALLSGLLITVLVVVTSFVVDLGMQRVARTDMQALADVVALDLSRELDGRTVAQLSSGARGLPVLAEASRARNADTLGDRAAVTFALGDIGAAGGFVPSSSTSAVPTAVKVTARTSVDFSFHTGSGGAVRSAVAAATSFACYKIGSYAATVASGNSVLLDPVLRQMAQQSSAFTNGGSVGALTYTGLAQTTVDLNQLAVALNLASLDALADATVSLRSLFVALEALAQPRNATTVNVLHVLATTAGSSAKVAMGRLLEADLGSASLLGATANVLDLVAGSIALLNGTNVANVYLNATLPSLTSAGLAVKLTQGPRQYCGRPGTPSTAGVASDTEQLNVRLGGQLNPTTVVFTQPTSSLLTSVASASLTAQNYATFDLSVAGTASRLGSLTCGSPQGVVLGVENGLATLTVSTPLRAEVRGRLAGIKIPGQLLTVADAVIAINAQVTVVAKVGGTGLTSVSIMVPPLAFDTPYATSSGGLGITSITRGSGSVSANVSLLGGALGAYIELTQNQQNQLLDSVLGAGLTQLFSPTDPRSLTTTVLNPLLGLIGARTGSSDVILDSVPALSCTVPRLTG